MQENSCSPRRQAVPPRTSAERSHDLADVPGDGLGSDTHGLHRADRRFGVSHAGLQFCCCVPIVHTVTVVLSSVCGFILDRVGLAFTTAIAGAVLAAICNIVIEQVSTGMLTNKRGMAMA